MDFDQTQAIYDYEEEEEEQVKQDKTNAKKKEAAQLKVFSQQGFKETFFPIFQGDNVIGRDGKCNITVPIKALSKKHACIEVQRDLHLIYDCQSKNRTKKGKSFLKPSIRYELKHGDMLTFGDVKCQYVVDLDTEEDEGDETGSETASESMLTTEEELNGDKPVVKEDFPNIAEATSGPPDKELMQPVQNSEKVPKPAIEDEEEAYAADTDSDTDDEQPVAAAAAAAAVTVLYSSEDEHETSAFRQKIASVPHKRNSTAEGQTLAFGLGSPDDVFRNRDSSSSNRGNTGNIPHLLMFSSESDVQSDGKGELSSDNRQNSPKHPEARNTGNQPSCEPTLLCGSDVDSPVKRPRNLEAKVLDKQDQASCQPTLLYGSESDDASPLKKPRHPETMASKKSDPSQPTLLYGSESDDGSPLKKPSHPQAGVSKNPDPSCQPTLLYGSESDDGSPIKKPTYREITNVPMVLGESDSEDGTDKAAGSNKHSHQIVSSWHGADTEVKSHDQQGPAVTREAEATLLYVAAEMSSTDDEEEAEGNPVVEKPSGRKELNNEEDNLATDEYGDDCATQPYAVDSNFETESETIPCVGADKSHANESAKPSELEATQAYCVEGGKEEEEEEEDSNSSDSQPLPLGPTSEAAAHGDMAVALAYDGFEATQAYNISVKDGNTVDEQDQDGRSPHGNDAAEPTLAYDLQATQAYGVCVGDDTDDEDNNKNESHVQRMGGQSCEPDIEVNGSDAVQATIPYGLEETQAYGADETDDEDSNDQRWAGSGGDQNKGSGETLTSSLAATLPYGGDDNDDDSEDNDGDDCNKRTDEHVRQVNQATLAYGLDETQAYDAESNDTDSASYNAVEATQAYGIEEPSEEEVQTKKVAVKKMSAKRVAFAGSSSDEKEDKASVTETGSVANVEEEFQDSEDVIQPRSRSRRGRRKPVIEESQEDESQQTSGRLSSSKRKSKAPKKLLNDENERKTAANSPTPGATEQFQAACEGPEDETLVTTASSRKGRREAMWVTVEADELDEEEEEDVPQETSLRRAARGKKAVEETDDHQERNEQVTSTTQVHTAGRKKGRQAAKRNVQKSGVEVKETPAPKSRRARREKAGQSDAVSVSETPLKTVHGTNNSDAADCQTSTPTDVEPTSVRRSGRGRARKGAATSQTVQKAQDSQETCFESQPETLVENTPSSTKGKGRGKRIQPLLSEQESINTTPRASVNSSEVKSQVSVAIPSASGKGRGRGKKKQSWTTELEVAETTVIEEDVQPTDKSPAVTEASKARTRGRQGRGSKRTQPSSTATLESSEDVSETLLTPEPGECSHMRKGRGRAKASSSVQGPSFDVEVEETPAKKSRHGKETVVAHSPSVKQGKPAGESNPRVIFTGLVDKQGEKVVTSLGGELVNNIHGCTHLVTDKVRRTVKFLCGLASGQIIVLPSWLDACKKTKSFVDTAPFLVKDQEAEKQYKFDLARSHEAALRKGLLEGYKVHVTKKVLPQPSQMKDIIQSAKGEFLSSMPRGKGDKVFVISCKEDRSVCKKPLEAGIPVVSAEVLLTGILRQELNLEEHKLFENEVSDTSQDLSTNSSGQNKRRREQSGTDPPASTAEKKSTSSKRRKK